MLILFYLLLCGTLFRRVSSERPVTRELLFGLCALYLQIALAFAQAYHLLNGLLPGAFIASNIDTSLQQDDFMYYSLVTLTTVGYGDIHAIAPLARLLAGMEAVVGVMFIALAVARTLALLQDDRG
jgi:voltage-gated potassium channel Kch